MAAKNNSSFTGRLKDEKKKLEERVNELKEEVKILQEEKKKLQEKVRENHDVCQAKINELEEKIERLQEEKNSLRERIREMETEIEGLKESKTILEEKYESIKQKNGELEKQLQMHDKMLMPSEDELIIRQLCSMVQQNILKIVLAKYFDKVDNKSTMYLNKYITKQIKDKDERQKAEIRWRKLEKEIDWDCYLITQLQQVKEKANETAHPALTEEKIDVAKKNLVTKGVLGRYSVEAVDKLKDIWKQTTRKLPQGSSSEKRQDQGGPVNLPDTGHDQRTYASKAAKGAQYMSNRRSNSYMIRPLILTHV